MTKGWFFENKNRVGNREHQKYEQEKNQHPEEQDICQGRVNRNRGSSCHLAVHGIVLHIQKQEFYRISNVLHFQEMRVDLDIVEAQIVVEERTQEA